MSDEAGNTIASTTTAASAATTTATTTTTTTTTALGDQKNYYYCYYINPLTLKALNPTPIHPLSQSFEAASCRQIKHPCPTTTLSPSYIKPLQAQVLHTLYHSRSKLHSCRQNTGARPEPSPHNPKVNPIVPTLFYLTLYSPNP